MIKYGVKLPPRSEKLSLGGDKKTIKPQKMLANFYDFSTLLSHPQYEQPKRPSSLYHLSWDKFV
ncbi:hypothetical protein PPBDW_II1351 [Photobacterium kishitanii]|nr:hypothetical protein PPBDW_II1351 [Photobacterium kishitanii]